MFLRPRGSKKIAKKVQNDQTWTHRGKYHGLGRANDEATKRNEEHPRQPPPWASHVLTTARGGSGTTMMSSMHGRASPRPQFAFFLFEFSAIFSVLAAILSLKEHVSTPIQGIIHHTILIHRALDFSLD